MGDSDAVFGGGDGTPGPRRSDDRVEYRLYIPSTAHVTSAAVLSQCLALVEEMLTPDRKVDGQASTSNTTHGGAPSGTSSSTSPSQPSTRFQRTHLWHAEPFALAQLDATAEHVPDEIVLGGSTYFGDNVEDEWLIVYVLRALTAALPAGTAARVWDADGEILLIEAAAALPSWLQPDTSAHRVWLMGGQLHIVPLPTTPATLGRFPVGTPPLAEALRLVRQPEPELPTLAQPEIQALLDKRLAVFPAALREQQHMALALLPPLAAQALLREPALVAAAVAAFTQRDPLDLRKARSMRRLLPEPVTFSSTTTAAAADAAASAGAPTPTPTPTPTTPTPTSSTSTLVLVPVLFSRCLYAQLMQPAFKPPKAYPASLATSSSAAAARHFDVGARLAFGLELLSWRCPSAHRAAQDPRLVQVGEHPKWQPFLDQLTDMGFFRGNIAGSAEHRRLLRRAEEHFRDSLAVADFLNPNHDTLSHVAACSVRLNRLLEQWTEREGGAEAVAAEVREQAAALVAEVGEDSDAWMFLEPDDLERTMRERFGDPEQFSGGTAAEAAAMQDLSARMQTFVDTLSSFEGADLPGGGVNLEEYFYKADLDEGLDDDEDDEDGDEDLDRNGEPRSGGNRQDAVSFDMSDFLRHLQRDMANDSDAQTRKDAAELAELQAAMEAELKESDVLGGFVQQSQGTGRRNPPGAAPASQPADTPAAAAHGASDAGVDVDLNLVKNMLSAFAAQDGGAGPASSLLSSLGFGPE